MSQTILEKVEEMLGSDWIIKDVALIDRTTYLVTAVWAHDEEEDSDNYKPYNDNKDANGWTRLLSINIQENFIDYLTLDQNLKFHMDGGIINGRKQAFWSSYNGVTYFLDIESQYFDDEELLLNTQNTGANSIRLIGKHFYLADAGNEIWRRESPKTWTMISQDPKAYRKQLGDSGFESVDGFSEEEIYASGEDGSLWTYINKTWHKIPVAKAWDFNNVICADDGKVYAVEERFGHIVYGRETHFAYIELAEKDQIRVTSICFFQGKLYAGGLDGFYTFDFTQKKWLNPQITGILKAEFLAAKDGVMFIGTPWTLKIYDGKNVIDLYGGEKETAKLLLQSYINSATELLESGNKLLDAVEKGKK